MTPERHQPASLAATFPLSILLEHLGKAESLPHTAAAMASLCAAFSSLSVQPRQLQTQKSAMGGQRLVAGESWLCSWPCVAHRRTGQAAPC